MMRRPKVSPSAILLLLVTICSIPSVLAKTNHGTADTPPPSGAAVSQQGQQERFALLIGVNYYVNSQWNSLRAPGDDVDLIKGLLVHQYQFPDDPKHIVSLVGKAATRKAIIDAFQNHLIGNAKLYQGATVVFYYSGHGSQTSDLMHETIVPSDSRTAGVFDILDDEVDDLFDELRKYTTNTTFILDSCHSGMLIKGVDSSLVVKEIPPDPRPQPLRPLRTSQVAVLRRKDLGNGILSRNDAYIAFAACLSFESAYESCMRSEGGDYTLSYTCEPASGGGYKPYSYFTHALVQTLAMNPNVTYREALDVVLAGLSGQVDQHPNVEGDGGRPVFGVGLDREDPFIRILGPLQGKKFRIAAGAIQGLQEGSFLAVYKPDTKKLSGEADKLANARVTAVDDFSATAELSVEPTTPISTSAKVAIVTPYFGSQRLRLNLLANVAGTALTDKERQFISQLGTRLKDNPSVELTSDKPPREGASRTHWDLGVQRGCLDPQGNAIPLGDSADICRRPVHAVYYLVAPGRNQPLLGFWVNLENPDASEDLVSTIQRRVKEESLRALTNARSPLNGKVKLSIIEVTAEDGADGKPVIKSERELPESKDGTPVGLPIGERFRLKIENSTDRDLDVVLIALGTSGAIHLLSPRGVGEQIPKHSSMITHQVWKLGPPLGLETYKVIAYTPNHDQPPPNFSLLEQSGVAPKDLKGLTSPLSWLVSQTVAGLAKDTTLETSLDLASWTVSRVDVYVQQGTQ